MFKTQVDIRDFQVLIDHFNQSCYFSDKIGTKNDHKTFKRRNGTDYYEYHHFIQQHKGRKINELEALIDDSRNIICLCSNCHNKIHYGQVSEVSKMLELLWKDETVQTLLEDYNFAWFIDKEPLDWINETYGANYVYEKRHNDNL